MWFSNAVSFHVSSLGVLALLNIEFGGGDAGGNDGGGLFNRGRSTTLIDSIVVNNRAARGGGIFNSDHIVSGPGFLILATTTIYDNAANSGGGGIFNQGVLSITDTRIENNTDEMLGGGGLTNTGTASLDNTDISNNTSGAGAGSGGGGIFNSRLTGTNQAGTLTMRNSTISGNQVLFGNGRGGGIDNTGGTLDLSNVTITNNEAQIQGGGIFSSGEVTARLQNSIIAKNRGPSNSPDCFGTLDSQGFNLLGNNANCSFNATIGDQVGTARSPIDPFLGPLNFNGGFTMTHALLTGSPAIDAGNPATPGSQANACQVTDQRRFVRSDRCDIGAYEFGAVPP